MSITTFELFLNDTSISRVSRKARLQPQNYRDSSLQATKLARRIHVRDSIDISPDLSMPIATVSRSATTRSEPPKDSRSLPVCAVSVPGCSIISPSIHGSAELGFSNVLLRPLLTPRNGPKPILAFGSMLSLKASLTPRNELIPYQCTISVASCTKSSRWCDSSLSIAASRYADSEISISSDEPSPPTSVFAMHQGLGSVLICWSHDESTASRYVVKVSESVDGPFTDFAGGSCYHKFCIAKNMPTGNPLYFAVAAVGTNGAFSDWVMAKSGKKQTIVTSLKVTAISGSVIESGFTAYSSSRSGRFVSSAKATGRIVVN